MNQKTGQTRTGKVTIRRGGKNSMRKDMCFSCLKYIRFLVPTGFLFCAINPAITDPEGWIIGMVSFFMVSIGYWLVDILVNKGTMIDSICFDYDNNMIR